LNNPLTSILNDERIIPRFTIYKTLERLHQEALSMNVFDEIMCYTEKDFDKDFMDKHWIFIQSNGRGYGNLTLFIKL
jgi:hypothetical protein